MWVCVCVCFMCIVSGWLCVCGQPGGTVSLHLRDSFYLPGTLTGKTASSSTHTCKRTFVYKCIFTHVPIFCLRFHILSHECVCVCVCEYLWLHSSRSSLECNSHGGNAALSLFPSRSLPLSTALSPSPGAHLCWLPLASCTVNVKSCHFAQMHK